MNLKKNNYRSSHIERNYRYINTQLGIFCAFKLSLLTELVVRTFWTCNIDPEHLYYLQKLPPPLFPVYIIFSKPENIINLSAHHFRISETLHDFFFQFHYLQYLGFKIKFDILITHMHILVVRHWLFQTQIYLSYQIIGIFLSARTGLMQNIYPCIMVILHYI